MTNNTNHWNITPREAREIQKSLRKHLVFDLDDLDVHLLGGVDISYSKKTNKMYAAVVILNANDLKVIGVGQAVMDATFPYIPGLLTFREGPAASKAFQNLDVKPDVIIFDGQGFAHPRFFGIACHLGLLWNIPSIGCAKKRLVGTYIEPTLKAKSQSDLTFHDQIIGRVLRTRHGVKPVFVSKGYRLALDAAVKIVIQSCAGYRLPEPTRLAHQIVNQMRMQYES
ncbi:endonuclease V [bacterium]|nr:endonuclease V [candidate division CSSED10-310 bacterium]